MNIQLQQKNDKFAMAELQYWNIKHIRRHSFAI